MLAELIAPAKRGLFAGARRPDVSERGTGVQGRIGTGPMSPDSEIAVVENLLTRHTSVRPVIGGSNYVAGGEPVLVLPNGAVIYEPRSVTGVRSSELDPLTWLLVGEDSPLTLAGLITLAAPYAACMEYGGRAAQRLKGVEASAVKSWARGDSLTESFPGLKGAANSALAIALLTGMVSGGVPFSREKAYSNRTGSEGGSPTPEHNRNWLPLALIALSTFLAACAERLGLTQTPAASPESPAIAPSQTPRAFPTEAVETHLPTPSVTAELLPAVAPTREGVFWNLPALVSSLGGSELEVIQNPVMYPSLIEKYIVLSGSIPTDSNIAGPKSDLAGVEICTSQEGSRICSSVSSVFPEFIADKQGLEFRYSSNLSQDSVIVYTREGSAQRLVFVNRFPDKSSLGLRFVSLIDRRDGTLYGAWMNPRGEIVEQIRHVRTLNPGERLKANFDLGVAFVGDEAIAIGGTAWELFPRADNLLLGNGWENFDPNVLKVLPGGLVEISGTGGGDGWSTVFNDRVSVRGFRGSFSVAAEFELNPQSQHAGLTVQDEIQPKEWWKTNRLEVSLTQGGTQVLVERYTGQSATASVLATWPFPLQGERKFAVEMRFVGKETAMIVLNGVTLGEVPISHLLDKDVLFIGLNAHPQERMTVSNLSVLVPPNQDGGVTVRGVRQAVSTPLPGGITVTPQGVEVTPIPPPVVEATPSDGNPFAKYPECGFLGDLGYRWDCGTGGTRSAAIEADYPGMDVQIWKAVPEVEGATEKLGTTTLAGLDSYVFVNPRYHYALWKRDGHASLLVLDWPADKVFP